MIFLAACGIFDHHHPIGPMDDSANHYDWVELDGEVAPRLADAVRRGIEATVATEVLADAPFVHAVMASTQAHVLQRPFFAELEAHHAQWATVVLEVRAQGMPDVFAALPYALSQYDPMRVSAGCGRGIWQIPPEHAARVEQIHSGRLSVRDCRIQGRDLLWTPTSVVGPLLHEAPWFSTEQGCMITSCAVDERSDVLLSTKGALSLLREAWDDPLVQSSGSAIPLTLTAGLIGADDARFGGRPRRTNVLPALRHHLAVSGPTSGATFLGTSLLCPSAEHRGTCGSLLHPGAQHFAYNVVAQHLLAVCYLGQEHGDHPAFAPWAVHSEPGGYCTTFTLPPASTVAGWPLHRP